MKKRILNPVLAVAISTLSCWGAPINLKSDLQYKTTPEGALVMDLYYPEKELSGNYPLVVYTHGGGWAAGSKKKAAAGKLGVGIGSKRYSAADFDPMRMLNVD